MKSHYLANRIIYVYDVGYNKMARFELTMKEKIADAEIKDLQSNWLGGSLEI